MNRIKCVLYDGTNFWYDKSPNFVKIDVGILDFFRRKGCVNKDNQINFINYKITFQRFGKKYRKCGYNK